MKSILSFLFTLLAVAQLQGSNVNWSTPPTVLSGVTLNASDPQVAINSNGDAVVVWVENAFVKSSSKPVSGSWSSVATLSLTGASSPRLVSDNTGNATAIWVENGFIKSASKTLLGSWGAATTLSMSGASSPTICIDTLGDVVAAWVRNNNIETSTKLFGLAWQARVSINGNTATTPSIAVGGSGSNIRAVIVWQGVASSTNMIFSSTKLIGGSWSSAQVISDAAHNAAKPQVAVDSNANAAAVWYAYDITGNSYSNVVVTTAGRPSLTGNWSDVSGLSAPGIRNPSSLVARIAFDSIGNAIALWNTSFDDETFNIESAVKPVNGNWSAAVDLVNSNLYAYSAELSTTSYGDVLSLLSFYNGASLSIQSVESDINGFLNNFWSVPLTISLGDKNANPKIAASLSSNVIHAAAVWVHFDGTHNLIVASTGAKQLVLPPTALVATQSVNNFGVFTEYYNTLTWTASSDPNVVGYLIFRNGTFVEQVGADVTQFIDDNRTLAGPVTYGITAIDAQQNQSAMVSAIFP